MYFPEQQKETPSPGINASALVVTVEGVSRQAAIQFLEPVFAFENLNFLSSRSLRGLSDFKFHAVALLEGAEASLPLDGRVMDEHLRPVITSDETEAFRLIEPFDRSFGHNSTEPP